jgi:hypothetical protein
VEDHTLQHVLIKPNDLLLEEPIEINPFNDVFIKEPTKMAQFSNIFTKESVELHTKNMITNNLVEKGTSCNMSNQELVEEGIYDMLEKQLIDKVHVNPNFAQINDVLVNPITFVNFLEKVFLKGCIISEHCHF